MHLLKIKIKQEDHIRRSVSFEPFEKRITYGAHQGVQELYKVDIQEEQPSAMDHFVSSVGG